MILSLLKNKYILIGIAALFLIGGAVTYVEYTNKKISTLRTQLEVTRTNEKALTRGVEIWKDRYGREHTNSIMFANTITQLKTEQDSTNKRILNILKLQEKELKKLTQIGYVQTKVDTTLAKLVNIPTMPDTTIDLSDRPHLTNILKLSPTRIESKIELDNETVLAIKSHKEPIAPRKSTWFGRVIQNIFAPKHIVTEVDVMNTNPYIKTKQQRFIEITKD